MRLLDGFSGINKGLGPSELAGLGPQAPGLGRPFWGQPLDCGRQGQGAWSPVRRAKALERSQIHLPPCLRSGVIVFDALEVVVQVPFTRGVMKTDGDNAILLEEMKRYVPSTNFPIGWFQK